MLLAISLFCVLGVLKGAQLVGNAQPDQTRQPPSLLALILVGSVPVLAMVIYSMTGNPQLIGQPDQRSAAVSPAAQQAPAMAAGQPTAQDIDNMVAGLEARLRDNPDDVAGWRMLARSQLVLGRGAAAANSYDELLQRVEAPSPADLRGAIGARLTRDGERAAEQDDVVFALLKQLQDLSPNDPMAMFYLGNAYATRGEVALAQENWRKLQAQLPQNSPMLDILAQKLGESPTPSTNQ